MIDEAIKIWLLNYPGAFLSAIHGLQEMFLAANSICLQQNVGSRFSVEIISADDCQEVIRKNARLDAGMAATAIIIPPGCSIEYCSNPTQAVKNFISLNHSAGAFICSVCAGAFVLASIGLLNHRNATTHWALAPLFAQKFPEVFLDADKILINEGDIITAGGIMAWGDLGLELVGQFAGLEIMQQLGRHFVMDTGLREQRYYKFFSPRLDHGDKAILKAQYFMAKQLGQEIGISQLADLSCLTARTFLRRFVIATGFKPTQYLQHLRVQKACNLLETSDRSFEAIVHEVGYSDISAFRKIFIKIMGLTPGSFRRRFLKNNISLGQNN